MKLQELLVFASMVQSVAKGKVKPVDPIIQGSTYGNPCEACRACGHWRGGVWCFHSAVFLGKSEPARPVTDELGADCFYREHKGET